MGEMSMKNESIKKMVLTAMFLAIGLVLPFFTGQIPQIGSMLLPMHIPVFLCALIVGEKWAAPMAFILPLMRSMLFGMPPMYPTAIGMAFELATYAFAAGYLYGHSKWQCSIALLRCLVIAMVAGRVVWGIVQTILLGLGGNTFTMQAFMAGALFKAIPGIILQLILIPAVMIALNRTKLVPFKSYQGEQADFAK
jgi:predicted membrane protein